MDAIKESRVMALVEACLAGMPAVRFAYLFGSRAAGSHGPLSDTDVAVFLEGDGDPFAARLAVTEALVRALGDDRVDVVPLNEAPPLLRFEAVRHGLVVKEAREARLAFEERAVSDYLDTAHLRAVQTEALRERLGAGSR